MGLPTFAHPHSVTDQQVALTIAMEAIVLEVSIVPGTEEGAAIFQALDRDSDGALSDPEMRLFATEVLSNSTLTVDGIEKELTPTTVNHPTREGLGAGHDRIAIEARIMLDTPAIREIRFAMHHDAFEHDWTVQPWFGNNALPDNQPPVITRGGDNSAVTITFPTH